MYERLKPYTTYAVRTARPDPADQPLTPPRRGLGVRLLGWALLTASLGLVSCQSLLVP